MAAIMKATTWAGLAAECNRGKFEMRTPDQVKYDSAQNIARIKRQNVIRFAMEQHQAALNVLDRFEEQYLAKREPKSTLEKRTTEDIKIQNIQKLNKKHRSKWVPVTKPTETCLEQRSVDVVKISIAGGPMVSSMVTMETVKKPLNKTRTLKVKKQQRTVHMSKQALDVFTNTIAQIMKKRKMGFSLIDKRCSVHGAYRTFDGVTLPRVEVKHMKGLRRKIDCKVSIEVNELLRSLLRAQRMKRIFNANEFGPGSSGFVFPTQNLTGNIGFGRTETFIVRGRVDGRILDARSRIGFDTMLRIHHYSSVGQRFWQSFSETFVANRPRDIDHVCQSNFSVDECGSVAALVCQALLPCGKITCQQCAEKHGEMPTQTRLLSLRSKIQTTMDVLKADYPQFTNVIAFLKEQRMAASAVCTNYEAFSETTRLISERKESPFSHLKRINEIIIKGGGASESEFNEAADCIRELARYQRNRTENIKKGSLQSFRNKATGKAMVNTALMCDNQLSQNGAFIWGKRGFHAKRFFSNYFDKINPSEGYDKFVMREHPNGNRKLAIGKLIFSTNFETLRQQMKGEVVDVGPLTKACVGLQNGNFVYPCSCVTLDDGTPVTSHLMMPTKNHLVVGNTGDPKYVDLPTDISTTMYIAKPGYCFINIFLAMLVNVNEEEAKDFTKTVRDVLMPKLEQWPSLMDVATACYMMTLLHPDTANAELPRILVDHKTKTMHVIDSFGSLNTGYHILKANTVSQLILFANDSMESEMKHYKVGGVIKTNVEALAIKTLIKSIYNPKLMYQILLDDPYILVLGILSPGVLMAMFNSGTFEKAMLMYVNHKMEVVTIVSILSTLALKVSLSKTLIEQMNILDNSAGLLHDALQREHEPTHAFALAQATLQRIMARNDMNANLLLGGHEILRSATHSLMEKNYLNELEIAWQELSWFGRYSAIKESFQWRKHMPKHLHPQKSADLKGRYSISPRSLLTGMTEKLRKRKQACVDKLQLLCKTTTSRVRGTLFSFATYMVPDIFKFINVLIIVSLLLQISLSCKDMIDRIRKQKLLVAEAERNKQEEQIISLYMNLLEKLGKQPTRNEFKEYLGQMNPQLLAVCDDIVHISEPEEVTKTVHQAKATEEVQLEKMIAFVALTLMVFDNERSDCVYRILNKLKGLMGTLSTDVRHQSLDEIQDVLEAKKMVVDFELDTREIITPRSCDSTFEQWWANQLQRNNVVPHYRTEGHFMEFTRATAVAVASQIAHSEHQDFLIRGAVGSGKSTGLPHYLSQRGSVLLIEPTRPLAENVSKQLRREPFFCNPTLRMRGLSTFGSTPISVMTSGFALQLLVHNPTQIKEYDFIIFDECHVHDSSAMALRCLLYEYSCTAKILKVSATPPGREMEYKETQYPVNLRIEEALSFQQFTMAQGTGANADVTRDGDNILVYVSSYNEVDTLGKLLVDKGFKVTKVDGRTMKLGNVEITTSGTPQKKHFIVATNIIENGVTLDIDVVVDFGVKVVPMLDVDSRAIRYTKKSVTLGERIQRLGRVGRNKPGMALRIGHTEKGLEGVPEMVATEAAFACFTFGLPVMTNNVSTQLLSKCTVRQARTMKLFELTPFYMVNMVRYDGSMHHEIHKVLKKYKLRDSELQLNRMAIPFGVVTDWISASEYGRIGCMTDLPANCKIPFFHKDIPERMHEAIWEIVERNKGDAGFGRLHMINACKIAYTLQTDVHSIVNTVQTIDILLAQEMEKKAHFQALTSFNCSPSSFTLSNISNAIRSRYAQDYTTENISVLQAAKAQLLEFANLEADPNCYVNGVNQFARKVQNYGALECVQHQSEMEIRKVLKLKGAWDKSLITRDIIVLAGVTVGGVWMLYAKFKAAITEPVLHQGSNKRQRQKLKFRDARSNKEMREVYGNDETMAHYFGEAYTKKEKKSGKTRGMGTKTRKFVNMYGYDPADYSFVRFVDPLTGATKDENPHMDIGIVQDYFTDERRRQVNEDLLDPNQVRANTRIEAYFIKDFTKQALKVDLTPHNPFALCEKKATIAGFPEREFELRQTGQPKMVDAKQIPAKNEVDNECEVEHEGDSLLRGMRDYNPIASVICRLTNNSDGHRETLYGLGYGSLIITNRHLFKRNNGELSIQSRHGEFLVKNTTALQLLPCKDRDILLIQMPKDFPPFPSKLKFRNPEQNERVCMVGSLFQDKSITSIVSEASVTHPHEKSHFWKHFIQTKDGDCGLPFVSTRDGSVVGLHSLSSTKHTNYFACFPPDFEKTYLDTRINHDWKKHWKYNADEVCWGSLKLTESTPSGMFKIQKLLTDLSEEAVYTQSSTQGWMYNSLHGNLKAVAKCPNQLVTKHVVRGKCPLFQTYLATHADAEAYFKPLMGAYQKSRLNREAYVKDIMKYSTPIVIGEVDCLTFERALQRFGQRLRDLGMRTCDYVTDHNTIFQALNMKSATGALYGGKKKDYFACYEESDREQIVRESCLRLYLSKVGIWNGALKSELRPVEKVMENKTRTFTAAPIDTLLGAKVCVDDFNNQFYDLNLVAPWSVGMTKFHGGWDILLTALPDGWIYCDADGSQFDSSLTPYLINAVLELRLNFMEEWDIGEQMLKNLYTEIVYTPISTPDGTVVKKFRGNNSGQPSTVVDNTLMVLLALAYSLEALGFSAEEHNNICRYFVNGDDLLIAVEPKYEFILDKLQSLFLTLGLKYTFDSRTRNKEDLWFMSHKGIQVDGMYIPKLEEERIVSILEWDRSLEHAHRLEAICAAMIESWGYTELTHRIREFYSWILEQAPYNELALEGKAPYISELALRRLYTCIQPSTDELEVYLANFYNEVQSSDDYLVIHQSGKDQIDAGDNRGNKNKEKDSNSDSRENKEVRREQDVNVGTSGIHTVPKLKALSAKLATPKVRGKEILNFNHLVQYNPEQVDISNARASQQQFSTWYDGVMSDYGINESEMAIVMNGLMVWCIENGTSPNINGKWVMMDGSEQVEFPIKPLLDHAKPTFRQIMAHFSNIAEAYIEKRNSEKPYMPRYGLQRNLTDMSLARYAFDFYEMTSRTPTRAREAHIQMKAAALRNANTHLFGLDGNVNTKEEDTERHTAEDVNRNMHTLLGVRGT